MPSKPANRLEQADTALQIRNLRIEGVSKEDNCINLEIKKGQVHALMGESGAGKTGLAYILAGMNRTDSGTILVNNHPVEIKNPSQPLSLGIGVLFQNTGYSIIPHLTVKEYLYIWSNSFIFSGKRLVEKTERLLREFEINIHPGRVLSDLNQEECRLLSLMKLLAREPAVLVLDEPSSDLSESKKQHFFRIVRKFAEKGGAVLYLSNKLDEILQISDQVSILKDGGTVACFPIEFAKKYPEKILGLYFGREETGSAGDDEFKDVIDTILHTTELLTSEYELQDLLNLLAQKIAETSKADGSCILLLEETSMNVMESFRYLSGEIQAVDLKEEIIHHVIQAGKPLILSEIDPEDAARLFYQPGEIRSLVCVPIKARSKICGVIEVFYQQRKILNQEDIELLMTFATQVAIAIENTRLLGRSTLLKEAHHRIKNNLQSIISLLILQLHTESRKSLDAIVWQIIDRIKTIASVHEILSQDERGIGLINFRNLAKLIIANFEEKVMLKNIGITIDVEDLYVSYRTATSLGLVVNELMANCFEHAFPNGKAGKIILHLHSDEDKIYLQVVDDGVGFGMEQLDAGTLGLTLVKTLVSRDLRGTFDLANESGTSVGVIFPKKQINY